MKKIFTLIAGLILSVAVMAADRGPDLTIRSSKNYKIVVDGRSFYSNSSILRINNLSRGVHTIQVFEMRRGYYSQRERVVASTSFRMGKKDVRIFIDQMGRIHIIQDHDNGRYDRNDKHDNDRDWNNDRSRDNRPYDRNDRSRDNSPYERNDRRDDRRY